MSRIDNITKFAQRREEESIAKEVAELQRIENYKKQIIALRPRINEIIEVGNACINNNIKIEHTDTRQSYETKHFVTNRWSHLLGFVCDIESKNNKRISKLGIWGGGWCHYDLETDGITIDVSGRDAGYVLRRFVDEFDKFETEFYKYVDSVTQGK